MLFLGLKSKEGAPWTLGQGCRGLEVLRLGSKRSGAMAEEHEQEYAWASGAYSSWFVGVPGLFRRSHDRSRGANHPGLREPLHGACIRRLVSARRC